jgi:TRAP-type C4-dicarboxylate transport system permease small subunit
VKQVKEAYGAFYVINIVAQAIFTLLWNIGLALLIGWFSVSKLGAPEWIYAPLLVVGVLWGFYSMIKFILTATAGYERLERQASRSAEENKEEADQPNE